MCSVYTALVQIHNGITCQNNSLVTLKADIGEHDDAFYIICIVHVDAGKIHHAALFATTTVRVVAFPVHNWGKNLLFSVVSKNL